ncbi:MAG TPA: hypothetical protein VKP61_15085 [Candidatus Acidoferrum sp.]|nr:hypothetical protein [Candidatus Acidoferrum sp.]
MPVAAGIFAGLVLLIAWLESRSSAAAGPTAGTLDSAGDTEFYPAPPADDFSNAEVGDTILGGSGMPVTPAKIDLLAQAIATAEGWTNPNPNVVPRRAHNPGDLTRSFGEPTVGVANSEGVLEFSDDNAGWSALKGEATAMLTGASHVYSPNMTLLQVAQKYTGGDAADSWAKNAAAVLEITPDQTLADFLNL